MEGPEQAELVKQFMLVVAPEVAHHTLRFIPQASGYSEEALSDQRRLTASMNARLTLELAVHLAAQAASLQHVAAHTTAAKDSAQEQIKAVSFQQERGPEGTP